MLDIQLKKITNKFFKNEKIDPRVLDIHEELLKHQFDCFLVGGCLRDLLSNKIPKDFDLVTNAIPNQIVKIFKKRARLIGKRFPIVHVRKGSLIAEVSTFRSTQGLKRDFGKSGIILKDESWGNMEEDALRRDFTVNALYYDPSSKQIFDYVNSIEHIKEKSIRFIGPPIERIREDPLRMLRAIRFSAKLGTDLDNSIKDSIKHSADQISSVAKARLFDEFKKLFLSGHALPVWDILIKTSLPRLMWPDCRTEDPLIKSGLAHTDQRVKEKKPLSPAFIIALLFWKTFKNKTNQTKSANSEDIGEGILKRQNRLMSIPLRFRTQALKIWLFQKKLEVNHKNGNRSLIKDPTFRAGYDFLLIRSEFESSLSNQANFWTNAQQ